MKTKSIPLILTILSLGLSPALQAQDDHKDHAHAQEQKQEAPNGGRIVKTVQPNFEFFVTPERKVKITFLGEDGKPVAAKEQVITAIGGDRSNPTKLTFTKEGDSLISDKPLPDATESPIVLQVKVTPEAKTVTEKFNVNLANCPTCKHKEYACTCNH